MDGLPFSRTVEGWRTAIWARGGRRVQAREIFVRVWSAASSLFENEPAIVIIRYSSSFDFLKLCSSQAGTVIRFSLTERPTSFSSGNKQSGGTCSRDTAGFPHA